MAAVHACLGLAQLRSLVILVTPSVLMQVAKIQRPNRARKEVYSDYERPGLVGLLGWQACTTGD
jgi:hypothetical protein